MAKQIPYNLTSSVCCTLRANPGMMSPSNILAPPHRSRFAQTAFMVIMDRKPRIRYALGRTNGRGKDKGGNGTVNFHVMEHFNCVTSSRFSNREQWNSGNSRTVKFKLMPDGHIRGIQAQRKDAASASEWMIYQPGGCAPTLSTTHPTKLLIADEAVYGSFTIASRGRGTTNVQHFEARTDGCTNTITSVQKNNLICFMKKRFVIAKTRSVQGKLIRRRYRNDIGVPFALTKGYSLHLDGISGAITSFTTDNNIMELKQQQNMENMTYHEHPTKEQLIEYFSPRIRIRKMTPREAFRLMDVSDEDIEKIQAYPFKTYAEREVAIANANKKELARIKRESICKTAQYKLAGNSIVTQVLTCIFAELFVPSHMNRTQPIQLTLF